MHMILPERVYYVECPGDNTVNIAMDVRVHNDRITWFDTIKERNMRIQQLTDPSLNHFVFVRGDGDPGRIYTFVPMTLDIYNAKVKSRLVNGKEFLEEADLLAAFEKTKNDVW
jgi:hypothetical protein